MTETLLNIIRHGCSHRNPSFPVRSVQSCLDCGAERDTTILTGNERTVIGRWKKGPRRS